MTPLIADFGICHMQGDERLTLTDEAKGSINYIAPEMESGGSTRFGPPKPETDGYSIGKVLYWMLSGGLIFSRERHRDRPLTLLLGDQRYEHVHSFLDEVVVEDPGRRIKFNSMAERLRDVRQLVDGGFTPLKPSMGLRCRFCGIGEYQRIARNNAGAQHVDERNLLRIGLQNFANTNIGTLRCTHCGHIEIFDLSGDVTGGNWWEK